MNNYRNNDLYQIVKWNDGYTYIYELKEGRLRANPYMEQPLLSLTNREAKELGL